MKRRMLAFVLVLALCMCLVPVASFAANNQPYSATIVPAQFIYGMGNAIKAGITDVVGTGTALVTLIYNMVASSVAALIGSFHNIIGIAPLF